MMTMRLIIGFVKRLCDLDDLRGFSSPEAKALYELQRAPPPGFVGLQSIVRRIQHLNAVYVDIDGNKLTDFLLACKNWDPVDYCDENVRLATSASYADTVPAAYKLGADLRSVLVNEHSAKVKDAGSLGIGIRIALIDSGVSPHPYLPALNSRELRYKLSTLHSTIPKPDRHSICDLLEACEQAAGVDGIGIDIMTGHTPPANPNTQPTPIYGPSSLAQRVESEFLTYQSVKWRNWRHEIANWLNQQRRGTKPGVPTYRHLAGPLRLFSPHSRNFVASAGSLGIMDCDGHGTRMLGAIAALRPTISSASIEAQFDGTADHPLMQSANGLCPYAELIVLKCFHKLAPEDEALLNGSLFDMVNALEYAIGLRVDILYIGLSAYDLTFPAGQAVTDLLTELRAKGTVIIAPAGNRGKTVPELAFPAGVRSVKAVTSVCRDRASGAIERCDYSGRASKVHRQRVAFSAFGGTLEEPIVTSNRGSGFEGAAGTSVAAAIAASIYGAAAAANYRKQLSREYDTLVSHSGQIDVDLVEAKIRDWVEPPQNRDLLSEAIDKACLSINGSSHSTISDEFGAGLIQMLDDHLLP